MPTGCGRPEHFRSGLLGTAEYLKDESKDHNSVLVQVTLVFLAWRPVTAHHPLALPCCVYGGP